MHKFVSANSRRETELSLPSLELSHIIFDNTMCTMISPSRRLLQEVARCNYVQCSKVLPTCCSFSTNPRWTMGEPLQPWAQSKQPSYNSASSLSRYSPLTPTNFDRNKTLTAFSLPLHHQIRLSEMIHHIPLAVQIRKQRDIPVGDPADPILRLLRYVF